MNKRSDIQRVVILFSVPMQRAELSRVVQSLAARGWEIVALDHREVEETFHARVECRPRATWSGVDALKQELCVGEGYDESQITVQTVRQSPVLGLMLGESCCLLSDVTKNFASSSAPPDIAFIASANDALEVHADRHGVPFFLLASNDTHEQEYELNKLLRRYQPSVVGVSRWQNPLSAKFVRAHREVLFAVQSGFVAASVGQAVVSLETEWAVQHGAEVVVASSFLYSDQIGREVLLSQQSERVEGALNIESIEQVRQQQESDIFLHTVAKLLDCRVLVNTHRAVIFWT